MKKLTVAVIGDGRWGCSLATLVARNGQKVTIYGLPESIDRLNTTRMIPCSEIGFRLPRSIKVKVHESRKGIDYDFVPADVVFIAVPGKNLQETWDHWKHFLLTGNDAPIIAVATKGLVSSCEVIATPLDLIKAEKKCFLAMAAFPEGILRSNPTVGTIYGHGDFQTVANVFERSPIRFYTSNDFVGGQIGSAMKNPIAIAAGAARAMGFDEMTINALVGRGANEIWKFAKKLGADNDILGPNSTILSDLFGTCNSPYSHHVQAGIELVKGTKSSELEEKIGTVEGIHTLKILREFASDDYENHLPIHNVVGRMIFEGLPAKEALKELMDRPVH